MHFIRKPDGDQNHTIFVSPPIIIGSGIVIEYDSLKIDCRIFIYNILSRNKK